MSEEYFDGYLEGSAEGEIGFRERDYCLFMPTINHTIKLVNTRRFGYELTEFVEAKISGTLKYNKDNPHPVALLITKIEEIK